MRGERKQVQKIINVRSHSSQLMLMFIYLFIILFHSLATTTMFCISVPHLLEEIVREVFSSY